MPRGRHRHSPPLHRLLPPTAIAGVSLVCALGPWVFSEPAVLRVAAAVAAATAAVGAAVMRRWDVEAGKRVADLTRARASDEWRHEERVAELETDLEESRELRTKLEHKLRAKRTELANLRNEHAALLRRYATAETERASALEGRRLLEIEATAPEGARELTAGGEDTAGAPGTTSGAGTADAARGRTAARSTVPPQGAPAAGAPWAARGGAVGADAVADDADDEAEDVDDVPGEGGKPAFGVFSPAGSSLWLRANSALERIITQRASVKDTGRVSADGESGAGADSGPVAVADTGADAAVEAVAGAEAVVEAEADVEAEAAAEADSGADTESDADTGTEAEAGAGGEAETETEADGTVTETETDGADDADGTEAPGRREGEDRDGAGAADASDEQPAKGLTVKDGSGKGGSPEDDPDGPNGGGTRQGRSAEAEAEAERATVVTAEEDDPAGKPGAVDVDEHATARPAPEAPSPAAPVPARSETSPEPVEPALPAVRPPGHFTVPTAVAVVPAAPRRRTAVEGGFDFFGTQKEADVIEAVQNEDLADVVGQEALALHKAESEARFKRMDEAARGVGQVIDLTAHDETEQIDLHGLRTAAS